MKIISSFSRTVGRKLSNTQKNFLNNSLKNYLINEDQQIKMIFESDKKISVEIGFGSGEHLVHLAEINKETLFIGCEPFLNGVANLLKHIDVREVNNIRIWQQDARLIIEKSPIDRLDKIYILFPDPWPKVKHNKRRIISIQTLDILHSKLRKDGEITIATDHIEYAKYIKNTILDHKKFIITNQDLRTEPKLWVKTRYQMKAELQNLKPYFFLLKKTD